MTIAATPSIEADVLRVSKCNYIILLHPMSTLPDIRRRIHTIRTDSLCGILAVVAL